MAEIKQLTVAEIEGSLVNGRAIIKRGRKIVLRVYNRVMMFGRPLSNPKETWSIDLPHFGVSIQGEDLADIVQKVNDFLYPSAKLSAKITYQTYQ